ncbi:MAG: hypothetical protein NZM43_08320 [Saprospiraceae bacterium]|nr:hypothetical protein [Saprospiraceae bacterium]MDW8484314.1 hypothetical protein [Saprospiraceae bacterium]
MQQLWKQWSASAEQPERPLIQETDSLLRHPHHSPLLQLRRNARINLGFSVGFTAVFAILLAYFEHPYIRACLGVVVLGYVASAWHTYGQLRRLPALPDMSGDLLPVVRAYRDLMQRWLAWQKRVALLFYPISAVGGALVGMSLGGNLETLLEQPRIWWILGGIALAITPLAHLLAAYLSEAAFGRYLTQLHSIVDFLEKKE